MAPNFKVMGFTMTVAIASKWLLDTEDPVQAWIVRGAYLVSQLVSYGIMATLYIKAKNNTEPGVVTVKEDAGFGQVGEKDEKVTISEHDMRFCAKEIQRFVIGSVVTLFLHWKWGFFPPLVIQAFTQPYNVMQSPLAKVTLRGERAWGELRRPWTDPTAVGGKNWDIWNDTLNSAFSGEPTVRTSKKALKKAAAAKRKNK